MNELVQQIQQKTGLSAEMAQKVVEVVTGYLRNRMPAPMASGLDSLLGASGAAGAGESSHEGGGLMDEAKSVMGGLGGMMGNKES